MLINPIAVISAFFDNIKENKGKLLGNFHTDNMFLGSVLPVHSPLRSQYLPSVIAE